ncbi:MAG: 50S ribosomal protein L10 [Armatimonadota bacterium]|nr:50S ribosomal protein L10 [Armatimonadota bacterium]
MAQDYTIEPAGAKVELVAELTELVGQTKAAILTDYRGLSVAELTDLRKKLRAADAEFRVVKNTLFKRAAGNFMPADQMDELLSGPTAIGFAKSDPVAVAKILLDYARDHKAMSLKAGVMDGRILSTAQVEALSKTPPREVLIAQMLGSLQSPISGFVGTLNGIISNFVFTLQAIADKQGAGSAGEAEAAA